jgi:D-sedoheptulose 7-phosphate isomerase
MTQINIQSIIEKSIATKQQIINDHILMETTQKIADSIINCYKNGGKVLFCGNGGSAADAQHLAAELSGRFYFDRAPLEAEALHVNSSYVTAVANDYSYNDIYSRYVNGKMVTVALTGQTGGKMKDVADFLLNVPSTDTPRIQESHIMLGHIICEIVEAGLFERK